MRGMILAAGLGTRLRPLTLLRAKPAVPLLNRPLIQYARELLQMAGIRDIAVNLHHLPSTVVEALGNDTGNLIFSHEDQILGTAGALWRMRDFLRHDTSVIMNGKIYFEEDLRRVLKIHRQRQALVTLVLVHCPPGSPFNPVFVDTDFRVVGFGRKMAEEPGDNRLSSFMFTGIHIIEPGLFYYLSEAPSDTVNDVYPQLLRDDLPVFGFVSQAQWREFSTPLRYLEGSLQLLRSKKSSHTTGSVIDSVVGQDFSAGTDCQLLRCVLWNRVRIGKGVRLKNAIVTDDAYISDEQHFENSIITPPLDKLPADLTERAEQMGPVWVWPNSSLEAVS